MNGRTYAISTLSGTVIVIAIIVAGIATGLTVLFSNNEGGTAIPPYLKGSSTPISSLSSTSASSASTGTPQTNLPGSSSTYTRSSFIRSSVSSFSQNTTSLNSVSTSSVASSSSIFSSSSSTSSLSSSTTTTTSTTTGTKVANETDYTLFNTNDTTRAEYAAVPSFECGVRYCHNSNYSLLSVSASWIVPKASCHNVSGTQEEIASIWVGIEDNGHTNDLEQIGTSTGCLGQTPYYNAWYEFFPAIPIYIQNINAGERIFAQVSFSQSSSKNYTLTISDKTKGWTKTFIGSGGGNYEADWAVERPGGGVFPLTDFGSMTFTNCTMDVLSPNGMSILAPVLYHDYVIRSNLTNHDYSHILALTSDLTNDGTAFTVTWQNSQ